ncbi:MAG: hypothetical protein F4150_03750, partial [Chloroflexi bacterium]|nr:hypothetical protein [Chloroflexota bacterium]
MSRVLWRRLGAPIALLSAALIGAALIACGGGDDETQTTAAPAAEAEPIAVVASTGILADFAQLVAG